MRRFEVLLVEETREHFDVVGDYVQAAEYLLLGAEFEVLLAELRDHALHEFFGVHHVHHFGAAFVCDWILAGTFLFTILCCCCFFCFY